MTALNNPGLNGDVQFDTIIYASAGLNYCGRAGFGAVQHL